MNFQGTEKATLVPQCLTASSSPHEEQHGCVGLLRQPLHPQYNNLQHHHHDQHHHYPTYMGASKSYPYILTPSEPYTLYPSL